MIVRSLAYKLSRLMLEEARNAMKNFFEKKTREFIGAMGKFAKFKVPKVYTKNISPLAVTTEVIHKFGAPSIFEKLNETKATSSSLVKLLDHLVIGSQLTKDSALSIMKNIRLKKDAVDYTLHQTKFNCDLSNGLVRVQTNYRGKIEKLETSPTLQTFPLPVQKEFITSAVANCMLQSRQLTREYNHQIKEDAMQELYEELEKYDQSDALIFGAESSQLNGLQIDYAASYLDARDDLDYKGDIPPDVTNSFEMTTLYTMEDALAEEEEDGEGRTNDDDSQSKSSGSSAFAYLGGIEDADALTRTEASEHFNKLTESEPERFNLHTLRRHNIDSSFDDLVETGDLIDYKPDALEFEDIREQIIGSSKKRKGKQ